MAVWRLFLNLTCWFGNRVMEPTANYNGSLARFKF
jgi:hypothetical protein